MKKIYVITGIFILLFILVGPGYAGYNTIDSIYSNHFMKIDARDAFNRPVTEENRLFQAPFNTYSKLPDISIAPWNVAPIDNSLKYTSKKIFKIPFIATPFIYSSRKTLSRFTVKVSVNNPLYKNWLFFLILPFILLCKEKLPTLDEPRFRVPVLIE